jgi:toxin ParE1/3/4
MRFSVYLTDDAANDLELISDYIARHDSKSRAEYVFDGIESAFSVLAEYPDRGSHPKELLELGILDYREVFFKPYRIMYRIIGNRVYVMLIIDSRRDIQKMLYRRLLHR